MKKLLLTTLIAAISTSAFAQKKKPEPPVLKTTFANSLQAVVVIADDWSSTKGTAQLVERTKAGSDLKPVGDPFPVMLGRSGLAWGEGDFPKLNASKIKVEGDGNAPAGMFPLTSAFGTAVKPTAVEMPYTRLGEYTECVDDTNSSFYNRIVDRMQVGNFDWKSSEKMLAVGDPYGLGVFVAYNSFPVIKGKGSCIFMHVWKTPETPTEGCTAMERRNVERIVAWLQPSKNPYLIQFTRAEYEAQRKAWKLPKL